LTITLSPNSSKGKPVDGLSRGHLGTFICRMSVYQLILTRKSREPHKLPQSLARISNVALRSIMPSRSTLCHPFPQLHSPQQLLETLKTVLQSIDGALCQAAPTDDSEYPTPPLLVSAMQNTWSRSARRKKLSQVPQVSNNSTFASIKPHAPALKCVISCNGEETDHDTQGALNLEVSWVQGRDRALFESFWNHVCRKVAETS